ncbi:MAG: peptidylprolyl isomerase [Ignavibacteriales bacterium]|nr:peptidylprolyl isomerase [Ignavibacteriales bacterium]
MLNKRIIYLCLPLIALLSYCTPEHSKIIVAEYGDYKIFMDEFEKAYAKNAGSLEKAKKDSLQNYENFLDLYVNYKMKLRNAEVRGYDKNSAMQNEIKEYKTNIGSTLFMESKITGPGTRELYERRKTEVLAAHISLIPDSSFTALQVEGLGAELIQRINNGEDFAELAKKYSKDTRSKDRGGVVGWVTAGQIIIPAIEKALYETEAGKIYPKLLKSSIAYHIIKVLQKQPRRGELRAQHILAMFKDSTGAVDSAKAYQKILEAQKMIDAGEDFGKVAVKYSDDKWSAQRNGDLGTFERGKMVPEFEEAVWKLKVGEVSQIVKTMYGYHIIKVNEEAPLLTYEQQKTELTDIYNKVKYKEDFSALVEELKKEFGYKLNDETFYKISSMLDSVQVGPAYSTSKVHRELGTSTIFTTTAGNYVTDSLFSYLLKKGVYVAKKLNMSQLEDAVKQYTGDMLVKEKALNYDKVNPEFAALMEDYANGIYLFKIMEEEIWSEVNVDSTMLRNFYEQNKQNYNWKERVEFKEVFTRKDSLASKYYNLAAAGSDFDTLVAKYSERKGYENIPGYYGLIEKDFSELAKQADALKNIGDISKPFKYQDGWSIVKLAARENPRTKTFDEARNEISSVVQENETKKLENEYVEKIKNIYKPKLNYEALQHAYKE